MKIKLVKQTQNTYHYEESGTIYKYRNRRRFSGRRFRRWNNTRFDFQNCSVVFDAVLDSNQKPIDPVFTRGKHNDLDVYYLSQSYFDLPKRTNRSIFFNFFQQTLKDIEPIYSDIAGFDMSHDEFTSLCREAWREKYNYSLLNRLEDKNGETKYRICNEYIRSIKSLIHKPILFEMGKTTEKDFYSFEFMIFSSLNTFISLPSFTPCLF